MARLVASTTWCSRSATSTRPSTSTVASSSSSCAGACRAWPSSTWVTSSSCSPRAATSRPTGSATSGSWSTTVSEVRRRLEARRERRSCPAAASTSATLGQPRAGGRVRRRAVLEDARACSRNGAGGLEKSEAALRRAAREGPAASRARAVAAACSSVGSTTGQDCPIAFGLPGKLTISVRPRIPRHAAGEDAQRRVLARVGADRLRVAGRLALDHVARGLRRHVVGGEAGAAGGEDEAHALLVGQPLQHAAMASRSSDTVSRDDLEPGRLAQLRQRGPETSSPSPRASEVETVTTAALTRAPVVACRPTSRAARPR